jgi:hypothetical protein
MNQTNANMKISLLLLSGLTALTAVAQNPAAPRQPDPFPPPAPVAADKPEVAPVPPAAPQARPPARSIRRAVAEPAAEADADATTTELLKLSKAGINIKNRSNLDAFLPRSTKTGRTLVIQSADPDPGPLANAEEDLSVMGLILRKATGSASSDDKRRALGIEVDAMIFGSSSGARNIYLEGYGALFLLGVRFPLLPPPDKADETATKDTTSSDWQQAREEFLNSSRDWFEENFERPWVGGDRQPSEDYDKEKVEDLKTALLESMKNATHIRILKPTDYFTVVVQGAEIPRLEKTSTRGAYKGRADGRRGETVMTIRVKKSDIDAFANGTLDLAGFRKKTSVQSYLRRGDASVTTSQFHSTPKR